MNIIIRVFNSLLGKNDNRMFNVQRRKLEITKDIGLATCIMLATTLKKKLTC